MIEISLWKIAVVLFVAIIVLGPEQLSKTMRTLGKLNRQLNNFLKNTQKDFRSVTKTEDDKRIGDDPKKE